MTNLDHIINLINHGAQLLNSETGSLIPLTESFYRKAVETCRRSCCNAITYNLVLPGIDSELLLAIWTDGHVDSGSAEGVLACLDR